MGLTRRKCRTRWRPSSQLPWRASQIGWDTGRAMNPLRRHLTPLAAETISPLNLPPVRMGLLTKLNLLTVGLIFLTAIATTGLYLWKEWRLNEAELRAQGSTLVGIVAEASEHGLVTNDRPSLAGILDS